MKAWRIAWKLVAITFHSVYAVLAIFGGNGVSWLLRRLGAARGSDEARRMRVFQRWARRMASALGMRIEVRGEPPRPPFFLVSNHLGYVDIFLLGSALPCTFVAKAEVADWPVIGAMCKSVNTMFIDRTHKRDIPRVLDRITALLDSRQGVVFFPEGTSTSGERVQRFRPSLLEAAARGSIPVRYATLSYSTPAGSSPARHSVCWWGGTGFAEHLLRLLQLPEFGATLTFGEEPIVAADRKSLADRLHAAVAANFEPVRGGEETG